MLSNDKIIFDRYYCINSTQTNEIMVYTPHRIFIRVKAFIFILVPDGLQYLIYKHVLCVVPGNEH